MNPAQSRNEIVRHLEARPRAAVSDGKRRLMAAVLAVAARGRQKLSMRAIAKEVRMQPASIYSHFEGGRDELVAETVLFSYIDFLTDVVDATSNPDPDRQFEAVVSTHIHFQMANDWSDLWDELIDAEEHRPILTEETRAEVAELRGAYRGYVTALVEHQCPGPDIELRANLIIELLNRVHFGSAVMKLADFETISETTLAACRAIAGTAAERSAA